MKCPVDGFDLVMTERQGVEIDYCPKCRGVWLDRGELDKIIERSSQIESQYISRPSEAPPPVQQRPQVVIVDDDDDYERRTYGKKKRGFLGDMFDIFD